MAVRTRTWSARRAKLQPYRHSGSSPPSVGVLCGGDSVWRLMRVGVYVDAFNLHYGVVLCSPRVSIFKRSGICSGIARSA